MPRQRTANAEARGAYLQALTRARHRQSVDGLLRVAHAFAALGDRQMAVHSMRIAEDLGRQRADVGTQKRIRAVAMAIIGHPVPSGAAPDRR